MYPRFTCLTKIQENARPVQPSKQFLACNFKTSEFSLILDRPIHALGFQRVKKLSTVQCGLTSPAWTKLFNIILLSIHQAQADANTLPARISLNNFSHSLEINQVPFETTRSQELTPSP